MRSIPRLKPMGVSRSKYPEHEQYRRKTQKRLETLDYTPQTAKFLSGVLLALRDCKTPAQRDVILEMFTATARGEL